MFKLYCRIYQGAFKLVSKVLPWREPKLIEGENSVLKLSGYIKKENIGKVLIVTDKVIEALRLMDGLFASLKQDDIEYVVYDKTVPNPTIENIEQAYKLYHEQGCQAIIAFGGGSSLDCGKGVAARVARPRTKISRMKGVLKVLKKTPLIFAIPTTAGTGSEATVTVVISNPLTHEKYAINDTVLIPHYAVLDPVLTVGLPPHITATTGMDALTHAIEAYIGKSNTDQTLKLSEDAIKLIFENIETAYNNGADISARQNMLKASYFAGVSFTRAYVGNIHAVAHTLGGRYSTPHGLANSVILPVVLEYYGEVVHKPLSKLADIVGISQNGDTVAQKSDRFIKAIRDFNAHMNIPQKISDINQEDIPFMVKRAFSECNPLYPVPKIFSKQDYTNIYLLIKG